MKKTLIFSCTIILVSALIMSYSSGPAQSNQNRTGSDGGATTCGAGCHTGGSFTNTFDLTLSNTAGTVTYTTWQPGQQYKISLNGTTTAPRIGFQLSAAYFNGSANQQAGSFSNLPSNTHTANLGGFTIVEHNQALTGINTSFFWTAPAAGSIDTIKFYVTVNGVNNTGAMDGDNSTNKVFKFGKATTSVHELETAEMVSTYPNPVVDRWMIDTKTSGSLLLYSGDGKMVMKRELEKGENILNTSGLAAGGYFYVVYHTGEMIGHGRINKL